ncbi:ComF family protein [Wenyingzhuangia heitensis]|uniref:ComF family protein n=1 Tax=Wenyingzhuangia heitensis TaxID=1487859 RepID=A0ABX0U5J0_9FLAO|nr:phosphoribosyltransferase family protein [Wenyingzhuangia heitensis]NIJ44122.1 ComF family protein [Wenyingzhuangia heitensis]
MNLLKNLRDLFVPYRCLHCKTITHKNQKFLCLPCSLQLSHTNFTNYNNNPLEKLFWGRVEIHQASSLYFYYKDSPIQTLLKSLKYRGLQNFGTDAAKTLIHELQNTSRFSNIDLVIPVPLHPKKKKLRGYNQVETFGKTIAKSLNATYIPDGLLKIVHNKSQTKQSKEERHNSVKHIFKANPKHNLNYLNVLIVDDVLTTGATLLACINTLKKAYNVNISIITIACVV